MQRLYPLQNGHVGSKIKIAKIYSTSTLETFCAKTLLKKHQIFDK